MARRSSERLTAASHGPVEPQAPATPRSTRSSDAIDCLARHLRDNLDVQVVLRNHTLSPAQNGNSFGQKLYGFIQHLHWKAPAQLRQIVDDFETDCLGHLSSASSETRSKTLYDTLADHSWTILHSMQKSPFATASSPIFKVPQKPPRTTKDGRSLDMPDDTPIKFKLSDSARPTSRTLQNKTPSSSSKASASDSSIDSLNMGTVSSNATRGSNGTAMTSFETTGNQKPFRKPPDEQLSSSYTFSQGTKHAFESFAPEHQDDQVGLSIFDEGGDTEPNDTSDENPAKCRRSNEGRAILETEPNHNQRSPVIPPSARKHCDQHYQITNVPDAGFGPDPHMTTDELRFGVQIERARLVGEYSVRKSRVKDISKQEHVSDFVAVKGGLPFQHSNRAIWLAPSSTDTKLTFSGAIRLNPRKEGSSAFLTDLHPVKVEKSCRVQRHFGWHRFFYVTVPSLTHELPTHLRGQHEQLQEVFRTWLAKPHTLMGRTWRAFHVGQLKPKKRAGSNKARDYSKELRVVFFATKGEGIRDIPFETFLDWMIPFQPNLNQPACKAFARIDLMISATTSTFRFLPSQVRLGKDRTGVEDVLANGSDDVDPFIDTSDRFAGLLLKCFDKKEVMTDGCARISVGAAKLICEALGLVERPAAFQARINGAKGMWFISAPYETTDQYHLCVWIEIRRSQLKVQIRDEDFEAKVCEPDRWSFDVVKYSRASKMSDVHRDFMQILEDRNVPRGVLTQMVKERLDICAHGLLSALDDPAALAFWVANNTFRSDKTPEADEPRRLPQDSGLVSQMLIERAGYKPVENAVLAKAIKSLFEFRLQEARSQLRVPCLQSTMLVGIVDPTGELKPGEVHISLSRPLEDTATGETTEPNPFAGREVLVARHPTLRGSDMQKVRCVYKPALAHLKDVVVMSAHGRVPLAAKLQGGDYDGDTFWICADERLTEPFRNVPVFEQRGIEHFGIAQDKTTLGDLVSDDMRGSIEHVDAWLSKAFEFKLQPELLGAITIHLYKLSYLDKCLWTTSVCAIADLHDLIIDAAKNGYTFHRSQLVRYLKDNSFLNLDTNVKMAFNESIVRQVPNPGEKRSRLQDVVRSEMRRKRQDLHILDDILFRTVNPAIENALNHLDAALLPAHYLKQDDDLQYHLRQVEKMTQSISEEDLGAEKARLRLAIRKLCTQWGSCFPGGVLDRKRFETCCEQYDAIRPLKPNLVWDFSFGSMAPTMWQAVMVGMIASPDMYKHRIKFMLSMAKDVVCYIKSNSESGRNNIARVMANKKSTRPKLDLQPWGGAATTNNVDECMDEDEDDEFISSLDDTSFEGIA